MSYTEYHFGKLKKFVPPYGKDPEDWANQFLNTLKADRDTYYKTAIDQVIGECEEFWNKLINVNGEIYEIEDKDVSEDFDTLTKNEDGTFNYTMSFYNGGASFDEALRYLISANKNIFE